MSTRYWAIGFKDWTEIRSSPKPLIKHKSEHTREVPVPDYSTATWDRNGVAHYERYIPRKYKISVTNYVGGKVLGTLRTRSFIGYLGFGVGMGDIGELSAEQFKVLVDKGVKLDAG